MPINCDSIVAVQGFGGNFLKTTYKHTSIMCYISHLPGAIIVNFIPLLFVRLQYEYGLTTSQLALLVTVNFLIQLSVDFLGAKYIDRIGYKKGIVSANILATVGLIMLAILPDILPSPFVAMMLSVATYAVGGGLMEVLVSPIMDALPQETNTVRMSLLHSFYCWSLVVVILLSTLFFKIFGIENWKILALIWSAVPLMTAFGFAICPIRSQQGTEKNSTLPLLLKQPIFWMFVLLMVCSGATEQGMAQWASYFAEETLGVSKAVGDLLGPCIFAVLMGSGRLFFGLFGKKLNAELCLLLSGVFGVGGYILSAVTGPVVLSFIGCGLCGIGAAILWPTFIDLSKKYCAVGGTALFAMLAFGGDIGCFLGPETVALASDRLGTGIGGGFAVTVIYPALIIIGMLYIMKKGRKFQKNEI